MVRIQTEAGAISARLDSAGAARALLLAALLAISLLASAIHARAEGSAVVSNHPLAVTVACSVHVVSSAIQGGSAGGTSQSHEPATVPCGSVSCCCGIACHASAGLVASAELPVPTKVYHALPATERAGPGSLSPDTFRPPIN